MAVFDCYGTAVFEAAELSAILADRLGLRFVERESHYRGVYLLASDLGQRVEIQPNLIPGVFAEGELYDPDHRDVVTLVLVTGDVRDRVLAEGLGSVDSLLHLASGGTDTTG